MSLYPIGRRVWVIPLCQLGTISEANYQHHVNAQGRTRRPAHYVVQLDQDAGDYLCGASQLRGADYHCDGCGKWHEGTSWRSCQDGAPWEASRLHFCFLCATGKT